MLKVTFRALLCSLLIMVIAFGSANATSVVYPKVAKKAAVVPPRNGFNNQEAVKMLKTFYNKVIKNGCSSKYSHVKAATTSKMLQKIKNKEAIIDCNYFTGAGGEMCDDSIVSVKSIGNHKFKVVIRGHYGGEPKNSPNYRYTTSKTVTVVKSDGKYLIDDVK